MEINMMTTYIYSSPRIYAVAHIIHITHSSWVSNSLKSRLDPTLTSLRNSSNQSTTALPFEQASKPTRFSKLSIKWFKISFGNYPLMKEVQFWSFLKKSTKVNPELAWSKPEVPKFDYPFTLEPDYVIYFEIRPQFEV